MFEQSEPFFRHLGFARVVFEDPKTRGKDRATWGAGLQDDVFYRQLFARIDADLAREPGRPLFVAAINASNHYPFDQGPAHVPLAGYPTKYARNYLASLSAQDAWLATFFEELGRRPALRDAIVVLVGDHSFPADEHGVHFNGLGAYEESFRTAFALFWPGHVTGQRIEDRTFSQLDIAPTIADLLQLRGKSHFVGRSMFAAPAAPRGVPAPLVQPYDGVRLVAVRYPFKLEVHEAADQEHLYDLSNDPDEERDRIDDPSLRDERDALRRTIARIRASDAIVHQGRVWP
jgi:phosphoglycerol transferase MdoB-like AlkP superfamily enzyme